jgi:hypothetical protein
VVSVDAGNAVIMKGVDLKKRKCSPGHTGAFVLYGKGPYSEKEGVKGIRGDGMNRAGKRLKSQS